LIDEGDAVGLGVFLDETEARANHRAGLLRLYRLKLADGITALEKKLPVPTPVQLSLMTLGALDDFVELEIEESFDEDQAGPPRDAAAFQSRVTAAGRRLYALAETHGQQLAGLLEQRRALLDALTGLRRQSGCADGVADVERQLAFLFRPGFPRAPELWTRYPRYLKAIEIRLPRLKLDPGKDRAKGEPVRPFQARLDAHLERLGAGRLSPELERFAQLLQEFRVAQFAPEVGAAEKVSSPRLAAAWAAVEGGR
jgi:ATP-dependent helicase HrpA